MTVLEIVQARVDANNIQIPLVQLAVEEVEQAIKNYCNIQSVPEELKFTWANMAVDLIHYQDTSLKKQQSSDGLDSININDVSSIKMGDTSINLGKENTSGHKVNLDAIVMNYREQLNKFRRMVW